jgi:2-polyprenyl-3-methyl-5-hydroxy-6-metoxy-1,4-benzoquinol methylase
MTIKSIVVESIFGWGQTCVKKIEWVLPYVKGKRVLDIGFVGTHGFSDRPELWLHRHLAGAATECVGLDRDDTAVEYHKSRGYNAVVGDAQDFRMQDKFDVVTACDVLEHLQDPEGFFRSVRSVLVPKGLLILTVPNPWFWLRTYRAFFKTRNGGHPDHVCWYCQHTMKELLRRHAFSVVSIEFGSPEPSAYRMFFLPNAVKHSSIFVAARINEAQDL